MVVRIRSCLHEQVLLLTATLDSRIYCHPLPVNWIELNSLFTDVHQIIAISLKNREKFCSPSPVKWEVLRGVTSCTPVHEFVSFPVVEVAEDFLIEHRNKNKYL